LYMRVRSFSARIGWTISFGICNNAGYRKDRSIYVAYLVNN